MRECECGVKRGVCVCVSMCEGGRKGKGGKKSA